MSAAIITASTLLATTLMSSCSGNSDSAKPTANTLIEKHPLPDTLVVGTLYSPTSYFIYREEPMGFDYDLARRFTSDKGICMKLEVVPSLAKGIEMLDSGLIDLLAYEVPVTSDYLRHVVPCGTETVTHQVLVQPKKSKEGIITDVTQLPGREVYVEKGSKYHQRLENLDKELGGGIIIRPIARDTIITEDLIEMVSDGKIPLTVVDSDIARINKTYHSDLDISLEISFEQRAAWGVSKENTWLADSINAWTGQEQPRRERMELLKRYFELSKTENNGYISGPLFSGGRFSPFDNLFRRYAAKIGWDWRLLASQGYAESHFDSTVISWAGARGVMQLMPSTARAFGLSPDRITNNDANIETAVKVIAELNKTFRSKVKNEAERQKFIIAAYNSGAAHILDAIALARKHGYNPQIWDGNVETALSLKSNPAYYNDPVCRYGYFNASQTRNYVRQVMQIYNKARSKVPS